MKTPQDYIEELSSNIHIKYVGEKFTLTEDRKTTKKTVSIRMEKSVSEDAVQYPANCNNKEIIQKSFTAHFAKFKEKYLKDCFVLKQENGKKYVTITHDGETWESGPFKNADSKQSILETAFQEHVEQYIDKQIKNSNQYIIYDNQLSKGFPGNEETERLIVLVLEQEKSEYISKYLSEDGLRLKDMHPSLQNQENVLLAIRQNLAAIKFASKSILENMDKVILKEIEEYMENKLLIIELALAKSIDIKSKKTPILIKQIKSEILPISLALKEYKKRLLERQLAETQKPTVGLILSKMLALEPRILAIEKDLESIEAEIQRHKRKSGDFISSLTGKEPSNETGKTDKTSPSGDNKMGYKSN